jgi:hypothetical protein
MKQQVADFFLVVGFYQGSDLFLNLFSERYAA